MSAPPATPKSEKKNEYNPNWLGYTLMMLCSLINFSAVSNISFHRFEKQTAAALSFGLITFCLCALILIIDRFNLFREQFNYNAYMDGKFEGYTLLFFLVYWIVGTSFQTQVGGVAYSTLNVYFSSWGTLVSIVYTLNSWSEEKDILSLREMTALSATLSSWYVLMGSSLVVMGTCINILAQIKGKDNITQASVGFVIGLGSFVLSLCIILVHLKFFSHISCCSTGGMMELGCSSVAVVAWVALTAIFTQSDGIAATVIGTYCAREFYDGQFMQALEEDMIHENCTVEGNVVVNNVTIDSVYAACTDFQAENIPGSNLYFFTWIALMASINVGLKWKAQQALQFAQASQNRFAYGEKTGTEEGDEDDDDEAFVDAAAY
jgi:hypothetical protein